MSLGKNHMNLVHHHTFYIDFSPRYSFDGGCSFPGSDWFFDETPFLIKNPKLLHNHSTLNPNFWCRYSWVSIPFINLLFKLHHIGYHRYWIWWACKFSILVAFTICWRVCLEIMSTRSLTAHMMTAWCDSFIEIIILFNLISL